MIIVADVGGTKIRFGVSQDKQTISKNERHSTPKDYQQAIQLLTEKIKELSEGQIIESIVLGLPGVINHSLGRLKKAPHLPNWVDQPIQKQLSEIFSCQVILENDAILPAVAEAHTGAGQGYKTVGYITLSTGVGGIRIIDGLVDRSDISLEPGHKIIDPNGRFWPYCGQRGCFESIASGTAFYETYQIRPEDCDDPEIWRQHAANTALCLVKIIDLWNPEILTLGGSVSFKGEIFTKPLFEELKKERPNCKIALSKLGEEAPLLGGLYLL